MLIFHGIRKSKNQSRNGVIYCSFTSSIIHARNAIFFSSDNYSKYSVKQGCASKICRYMVDINKHDRAHLGSTWGDSQYRYCLHLQFPSLTKYGCYGI